MAELGKLGTKMNQVSEAIHKKYFMHKNANMPKSGENIYFSCETPDLTEENRGPDGQAGRRWRW